MLTTLNIRNFKAWKSTGDIRLAPISVFFGSNSSGKTSLHQFLLMLKQTAQSPDRRRVLHPGDEKTLVDLGTVQDLVHGHDSKNSLEFEVEWVLPTPLVLSEPTVQAQAKRGKTIKFSVGVGLGTGKIPSLFVERMRYQLGDLESGLAVSMIPKEHGKYILEAEGYELVRQPGRVWPLPPPIRFYGFPDEARAHYQNANFVADLALSLERMFGAISYVGPLREYPKRAYIWSGERPDSVGTRGERAVEAILSAAERSFNLRPKERKRTLDVLVAEWLSKMGLISSFEAKPLAEHRKEYEVMVRTKGSQHDVNLTDVGFGVSQLLPVLVLN